MLACPLFPRVRKLNRAVATLALTSLEDVEDVLIRSSLFLGGLWPPLVVLILDVQLISLLTVARMLKVFHHPTPPTFKGWVGNSMSCQSPASFSCIAFGFIW